MQNVERNSNRVLVFHYFTNGTSSNSVRINATEEQYIANLNTRDYAIKVGETYTVTIEDGLPWRIDYGR